MSLTKNLQDMLALFDEIKQEVKQRDRRLYDRWAAGGFNINADIVSMYPNVEEVVEELGDEDHEEEDEEEDEE